MGSLCFLHYSFLFFWWTKENSVFLLSQILSIWIGQHLFPSLKDFFLALPVIIMKSFLYLIAEVSFPFWRIMTDAQKNSIMPSKIPLSHFPRGTSEPSPTSQDTQEFCFKAVPHECLFLPCALHGWESPLWKAQCHAECAFFIKMWPVSRLVSVFHIQLTLWPNSHPHILDILLA